MTACTSENTEEMANESEYVEEPELFVMESLQPMLFSIRVCPTKAALQRIIEDHGGELTSKVGGPHTLRLLPIGEKSFSVSSDVFSAQYIYDCVKEKRLLDPSKYRVNKNSCYTDDIKVLDIIRGVRSWADCVRVEIEGPEDVSDFSDDENFNVLMQNRTWKTGRRPYSRNEQKSILEFIIKNKRYGEVKGNVLWKDMEKRKVCPLRSWESMKEHYRKVIITDLAPYQLSKKIEAKLYKGYTDGKYHKESSDDDEGSEVETEEKADNGKEKRDKESACESSDKENPIGNLILPELRKDQRGKAVTQKEVSSDPKETQVEDEQSELTWQEEADIEDEEETEDEDQEEADEEGIKKTMNDIMYDEVERQVASFDAGVANCTQSFEVVLADGEFENPPKQTDNYLKELADDWEESRGSFPGQSQNKEENAAAFAENKQERGRSESALTGNLQKSTRDEDGTQDREGVFSSSDPDEQSHQVVDAEIPSSESTSKIVKTKKNTDMFTEKEAEEIANYLIEMSNSDPWEEPAVTDLKHNKCGDAGGNSVQQNNCKGTSIVVNNGEQADTSTETIIFQTCPTSTDSHTNQEAGKDRNLVHDPCNSVDGKEITKVLLSPFLAETESSGEESDRSIILFSEGEICRKRSVGEEEADKKNLLNGSKGTRSSSASETKKKSKKGQLQDRQSGNSSVSSTSKDVSQEKIRMRKPQKRKPHLDESTSSDSEVLITRSRKVDMGQILSCPSKGVPQKTRSIHSEEETEEEDVSSHTPDRQRQNGRRSTEENSSPGGTSSGSLQRVKHQLQKERETKLDVSSEVMRKMKGGEKVSLEENSSDSDGNDDDSLITEEENNSYLSTSLMSDPCSSIDSFTGFYDRSFYPSRCHELRLDLTRRVAKISTGNGIKTAYTHEEDVKILRYIDDNSKHNLVGGRELWQKMEREGILPNRSWHSLKERYRKRIVPNLHIYQRYGLHKTMLERFKSKGDLQPMEELRRAKASETYRQPYSHMEDLRILNFIIRNKRHSEVGGKSLWTLMATCEGGLKGRSWLSLKERFRMSIVKHLHSFNLSDDEILKFEKYGNRSKNQKITHRHQPDASVYKFAKIRLSPRTKKRSATSSASESEVPREQKEEVSRRRSESEKERNVSGRRDGEEQTSTSVGHASNSDNGRFKLPLTEEKERAYSPEIPLLEGSVFEKKRKLYSEPEGNKVLTPQVMSVEENVDEGKRIKRRKLDDSFFGEKGIGERGIKGDRGSKQEREVSTDMHVDDSVEGHVESDDELPLLISRDKEVESDVEITAKIAEEQETEERKVNDSIEIGNENNFDNNQTGEEIAAPPTAVNSLVASDQSGPISPEIDKENISRTPVTFIPENERRLSPRKRNSMNFTQTPSSTTSQSETKRKKERNSLPATVSSHDKRVTRRFLELEKTLPRQKLRVRPLHKNK